MLWLFGVLNSFSLGVEVHSITVGFADPLHQKRALLEGWGIPTFCERQSVPCACCRTPCPIPSMPEGISPAPLPPGTAQSSATGAAPHKTTSEEHPVLLHVLLPSPWLAAAIISDPGSILHFPASFAQCHDGFVLTLIFQCNSVCSL